MYVNVDVDVDVDVNVNVNVNVDVDVNVNVDVDVNAPSPTHPRQHLHHPNYQPPRLLQLPQITTAHRRERIEDRPTLHR